MGNETKKIQDLREFKDILIMQIVAFDFGTKKIGIAVGQTQTMTSSPLDIVFSKNNKINWDGIMTILEEWKPGLILVGKPLNMDGTDSDIMEKVDIFYKKLEKLTKVKCEYGTKDYLACVERFYEKLKKKS